MKLDEILDKPAEFKVIIDDEQTFAARFIAGGREIQFDAVNEDGMDEGEDNGEWDIVFGEIKTKKRTMRLPGQTETFQSIDFDKTGSGAELEVFATLKAILNKFIKTKKPNKLTFSASKSDSNRASLYARLFKKNLPAGWKINRDDGGAHEPVIFSVVREGMMKRSDPWVSGDKWGPRPPDEKLAPKRDTAHRSKLETLMRKSGKSMEKVEAAWNKAVAETPAGPKQWANVMIRAKADLGIGS